MRASTAYVVPRESATEATVSVSLPLAPTRMIVFPAATPPAGTVSASWLVVEFVTEPDAIVLTKRGPVEDPVPTTTALSAEAATEAAELVAVTTTRRVDPTSPEATAYVAPAAPTMFEQVTPELSQ